MSLRVGIAATAVAAALLAPAGGASGTVDQPEAQASKACRAVQTHNGGRARSIVGRVTSCRTARRVAARARGRRYRALGYWCVPTKVSGDYDRRYGCYKGRSGRSVRFLYKRP